MPHGGMHNKPHLQGLPADYDQPMSPQPAPHAPEGSRCRTAQPRSRSTGPIVEVYQPPVPENLPDLYLTDLRRRRSRIWWNCCRT